MILILLLVALLLPPIIILAPPWRKLSPKMTRVRLAGAIIAVWTVAILWSMSGPATESDAAAGDYQVTQRNYSERSAAGPRVPGDDEENEQKEARPRFQDKSRKAKAKAAAATKPTDPLLDERPTSQPSVALQQGADGDQDIAWDWSVSAPLDTGWMLLLGWIPGLVYAGLLFLARRSLQPREPMPIQIIGDPRQYYRQ